MQHNATQTLLLPCLCFCVSDEDEENQDTVEQILKCIIENEGERITGDCYTIEKKYKET